MQRVIKHAKAHGYAKYTSTLEKDWRAALRGLTDSFTEMADEYRGIPDLTPDEVYEKDPAVAFGIIEAKKHRMRGVTLPMFIGLLKYNRKAYLELASEYLDLAVEMDGRESEKEAVLDYVNRFFDRVELGVMTDWSGLANETSLAELMVLNRMMTNEKNLYLSVFESIMSPVVLLQLDHMVINMNHAAYHLFRTEMNPGYVNNRESPSSKCFHWLEKELETFEEGGERDWMFNKEMITPEGKRVFQVHLSKMLDISEKYKGTVIAMEDITDKTTFAKQQAYYAEHDQLTGLSNRRILENALKKTVARAKRGVSGVLIYIDIDQLKAVNDNRGHQEGDKLIRTVADIIEKNARIEDICARLGGDEFAILLDNTTVNDAVTVAERLKESLPLKYKKSAEFGVGISAGVVEIDGTDDYLAVMSRGDVAMYSAKSKGRNRIVVA